MVHFVDVLGKRFIDKNFIGANAAMYPTINSPDLRSIADNDPITTNLGHEEIDHGGNILTKRFGIFTNIEDGT